MTAVEPIDLAQAYTLVNGLAVVPRNDATVQIGTEPARSVLLRRPPPDAVELLRELTSGVAVTELLRRHAADPLLWRELLTELRDAHLLVRAGDWAFPEVLPGTGFESERDSLVHRHGVAVARRVLQARRDAVVVVRGAGRVASAVAASLALAGVGHVHQQPDRALRPADLQHGLVPSPPPSAAPSILSRAGGSRPAAPDGSDRRAGAARPADAALLAANLRRVAPAVAVHRPAAHLRVALTVLAGEGPPAPSLAAELTGQFLPHLAARAGLTSAVVGPLVLPGRSSCLLCQLRRRTELDSGRAEVEEAMRREVVVPPTQLVAAAATLAVADALDHLDGVSVPSTLDGTLEWELGSAPRRRSWTVHPDCGCADGRMPATPGDDWTR